MKKFQDLQADLELLARRVQLLEAIIWPGNARLPSSKQVNPLLSPGQLEDQLTGSIQKKGSIQGQAPAVFLSY